MLDVVSHACVLLASSKEAQDSRLGARLVPGEVTCGCERKAKKRSVADTHFAGWCTSPCRVHVRRGRQSPAPWSRGDPGVRLAGRTGAPILRGRHRCSSAETPGAAGRRFHVEMCQNLIRCVLLCRNLFRCVLVRPAPIYTTTKRRSLSFWEGAGKPVIYCC